jgi:hypothetical protein
MMCLRGYCLAGGRGNVLENHVCGEQVLVQKISLEQSVPNAQRATGRIVSQIFRKSIINPSNKTWDHKNISSPTMKLSKTETKLPNSTMKSHGNVLLRNSEIISNYACYSSSPTFAKDACTKPLSEDHHHIFDVASDPNASLSSLDELTMGLLMTSHNSNCSSLDKMDSSFRSVGLPSDYPLDRKSTDFSSVAVEEELEDFERFDDDSTAKAQAQAQHNSFSSTSDQNPLECRLPASSPSRGSATHLTNDTQPLHYRRNRTEVGAFDDLVEIANPSRGHRRRNNRALGTKDFHELVLTELFG